MSNVWPTCRFLARTLRHKWYVMRAGLRTKAPIWRLLIHDWTKFLPSEAPHYGRRQFGAADDDMGFVLAWNHHSKLNPHHWEFWIPITSHRLSPFAPGCPLPMPEWAVREMVADWLGATKTYQGAYPQNLEGWSWFHEESKTMRLHDDTWLRVAAVVDRYFTRPLSP